MSNARTFSVCQGCGTWRETGSDVLSFFNDYDMPFFIEHHMACCPVTGKPEVLISVREGDSGYQPLPPDKQWKPESFSGYRARQEPKFTSYICDDAAKLAGVWHADSGFGGGGDETMILMPNGAGLLDFWNMGGYCGRQKFTWLLELPDQICFSATNGYFKAEKARFEIGLFTDSRGEQTDKLRIYHRGVGLKPSEFFRSKHTVDEYSKLKIERRDFGEDLYSTPEWTRAYEAIGLLLPSSRGEAAGTRFYITYHRLLNHVTSSGFSYEEEVVSWWIEIGLGKGFDTNIEVFDALFRGRKIPNGETIVIHEGCLFKGPVFCPGNRLRESVGEITEFIFDSDVIFVWPEERLICAWGGDFGNLAHAVVAT